MRLLVAILIGTACHSNTALATQDEFANDTSPSSPIVFTFKGGMIGALNFEWHQPTGEQAVGRFPFAGVGLEAHDLRGFVAGMGFDYSWNTWTRDQDGQYYGREIQRLNSYFLYGTIGHVFWKGAADRSRSWGSLDIGKMWSNENPKRTSTATLGSEFYTGVAVRVRGSYLRRITKSLALGITGGWQWAEPTLRSRYGSQIDPLPRFRLSGPMIAAQMSLFSPLGPLGRD